MSVQDAEAMLFDQRKLSISSSAVLFCITSAIPSASSSDCRRILKDGGVATFGEPFALGYGLGAVALMLAQKQLRTKHDAVTAFYDDLSIRIKGPDQVLAKLVDKHLFFRSAFIDMARRAGFSAVECVPLASREFYRECFIDELLTRAGYRGRSFVPNGERDLPRDIRSVRRSVVRPFHRSVPAAGLMALSRS